MRATWLYYMRQVWTSPTQAASCLIVVSAHCDVLVKDTLQCRRRRVAHFLTSRCMFDRKGQKNLISCSLRANLSVLHDTDAFTRNRTSCIRGYLASEFAAKCMGFKVALLTADPHPMQLPLKAIPQKHCSVCTNVCDVSLIFGCK